MNDRRGDGMSVSAPGTETRGTGSRGRATAAAEVATAALSKAIADVAVGGRLTGDATLGDIRVRVRHDASARQIEQALRAALRDAADGKGRRS